VRCASARHANKIKFGKTILSHYLEGNNTQQSEGVKSRLQTWYGASSRGSCYRAILSAFCYLNPLHTNKRIGTQVTKFPITKYIIFFFFFSLFFFS